MNKQDIINEIVDDIEMFEKEYHFTNSTGWNQATEQGASVCILYGQYSALVGLYEKITDSTWISKPVTIKLH